MTTTTPRPVRLHIIRNDYVGVTYCGALVPWAVSGDIDSATYADRVAAGAIFDDDSIPAHAVICRPCEATYTATDTEGGQL